MPPKKRLYSECLFYGRAKYISSAFLGAKGDEPRAADGMISLSAPAAFASWYAYISWIASVAAVA